MKQKERILNDVRDVLRYCEGGKYDERAAIIAINNLTAYGCAHCAYLHELCALDDQLTCANGFFEYLESEAE